MGRRHFGQHPHHQHDERAGQREGDDRRGTRGLDDDAAANKQTSAYHATQSYELHVASAQRTAQRRISHLIGIGRPASPTPPAQPRW